MISVNWLRELVPSLDASPDELARRFTLVAAAVERSEVVGEGLDGIVVARALDVRPHPNADRLKLCRVETGDGSPAPVVCGAPVVEEEGLYPYVPAGATLPGGMRIESRKIRGEQSDGMLCSERELRLGRDQSGILRLPDDLEVGAPLAEALGLPDVRWTLDLNPNRIDLACHLGVARELAPPGAEPQPRPAGGPGWEPRWVDGEEEAEAAGVAVRIDDPARCPRYLGAVIRGVEVRPSPAWLAGRLVAVGARPINNVVDVTNYLLYERNQPIHAFDLRAVRGLEIAIRPARRGEPLRTLDGENRELGPEATVIADRDGAVALAGVMGGEESEVTAETVDLFIECASFDPSAVRHTARATELSTEASYRFERGIDEHAVEAALARCVELVLEVAGGEAEAEAVRVGPPAPPPPVLPLRRGRVRRVLGIDPDAAELERLLAPIGFEHRPTEPGDDRGASRFAVPGWRRDVTREIDLVEEVARRFGYEDFPDEDRRVRPSAVPDDPAWARADRVRELLSAHGLLEARSVSFVPGEYRGNRAEVAIPNPLSAEEGYLRAGLVPVLLRCAEHNFTRGRRDIRLYEIGTVFRTAGPADSPAGGGPSRGDGGAPPSADRDASGAPDGTGRFREELRVGALLTGARAPTHWSRAGEDVDLWDLKGLAAAAAERLCEAALEPGGGDESGASALSGAWLADERFRIVREGRTIGVAGRVRPAAIDAPPWAGAVWALELDLNAVRIERDVTYAPLSAYPAVRRDLAVTVPRDVDAAAIEAAIRERASDLLDRVELFDVYAGEGVERGRRSLAWAFRFRAFDRTLTDGEVEAEMKGITDVLEERFDARVRAS